MAIANQHSSTVVGQVGFGILADIVGRKRMYGLELILIIFATVAQSLTAAGPGLSIVGTIVFCKPSPFLPRF